MRLSLFVYGLLFLYLAALALSLSPPPPLSPFAFWLFLSLFLARLQVPLPLMGQVSLHFVAALAAAFALPPAWASLAALLGLPLSPPPLREAFNRAQVGLASLASAHLFRLYPHEGGVVLGALAYFLLNLGSVLLLAWVQKGLPPTEAWRRNFAPYGVTYLLVSPVAYLLVRLYEVPLVGGWGGFGVLLVLLPLVYLRHMWLLRARLEEATRRMLQGMVLSLEARDPYTAFHSERVAAIAQDIARAMGLPEAERDVLLLGARLHDIGKIGIPDEVLLKPSPLTPWEWELMRTHPEKGYRVLSPLIPFLGPIEGIVLHHHERWDGTGYPRGLRGEEIPLLARIVAVADAYEAMTSDRPYRPGLLPEEALERIRRGAGSQFDPEVVEAFVRVFARKPPWWSREGFRPGVVP